MRARFLLALPALCLLLGCGLAGPCDPPTEVILYSLPANPYEDFDHPRGRTEWDCDGPTRVWVLDFLDEDETWRVLAHELWHVAGFTYHLEGPCAAAGSAGVGLSPCLEEMQAMEGVQRVFRLRPTLDIREATIRAADWWNDCLSRPMFVVE